MDAAGIVKEGFSFQTGTGGASLAVIRYLRALMQSRGVKASFVLGGITSQVAEMLEQGLVGAIFDVQSFDVDAARSMATNPRHFEIDASCYANPMSKGCAVNLLDVVILSALEVDEAFNVNVITGSDGVIRGASGGHSDTAAGAALTVVVAPLVRGRTASVVRRVETRRYARRDGGPSGHRLRNRCQPAPRRSQGRVARFGHPGVRHRRTPRKS